jgi:CHAT domain-containing protein
MAGARSTLLSLWKVDDDATRAFMVRYYALLKEGKGRGEALVQVQREFRTDPAYKAKNWDHPYYWAAWQLTGDWKPIQGL